jgi:hypothetical protein
MQPHETKAGPGGGAPEPRCIAQQANAVPEYSQTGQDSNPIGPGAERTPATPAARQGRSGLESPMRACEGKRWPNVAGNAYRDSEGRIWRYSGKRARVLDMLVVSPGGVTQWDCLPWHTRLGASIHAMREDGLAISTELEGEYRHARYRLATKLFGDDAPTEHRAGRLINNQRISNGGGHGG